VIESAGRLIEAESGRVVVESLRVADRYWSRLVGLQFRRALPYGTGLLIVPCSSIHTFFVRMPIDVIALDRLGTVIEICRQIRPWRVVLLPKNTHAVVEMSIGWSFCLAGWKLRFLPTPNREPRGSLDFLR
jgi:uncharacterized protein